MVGVEGWGRDVHVMRDGVQEGWVHVVWDGRDRCRRSGICAGKWADLKKKSN